MKYVSYLDNEDELNMGKERWWDVCERERTKRAPVPLCESSDIDKGKVKVHPKTGHEAPERE
jgi:hypothetical protein